MAGRAKSFEERIADDFEFFAEKVLRIRAKDGSIVPLVLNKAQKYLHARIEAQKAKTGKVRIIGLKGRQQGFSTYIQARFFWLLIRSLGGLRAYILTHEQDATNNLFEMAERFCNEAPFEISLSQSNAKELHFADSECGYKVGTAGNKATGRSSTLQLLHGSECAYWPNASAHKAGVIQAVPDLPGTEVILESTANGVGGMFHDDWLAAVAGESEYVPVFIPWFWQDEYRKPVPPGFKRTKAEELLAKRHGLDNGQLAWRRNKIAELKPSEGGNPEDLFKQEYPCLVGGTRISTARGLIPISEVVEGDAGDCGSITRQWSTGIKPVYEVETQLGYRITATANHPLALDAGGFVAVESALGARVQLQPPRFAENKHIATWRPAPCVESRFTVTADMGRCLGFFMGDGSFHSDTLSIACDGQDADIVSDVAGLMKLITGRANERVVGTKRGGVEVRTGFKYGRELLGVLGVIDGGDRLRRRVCVPECIWRSPKEVVRQFLRGLFEADGFAGDVPRVILFSKHREFLQDVQVLLLGFGITARLRSANKIAGNGMVYVGHELALRASEARLFGERIGFVSSRKSAKVAAWVSGISGRKPFPVEMADSVSVITSRGDAEVFDLTVEDSHVFGANGILVHNCTAEEAFLFSGRMVFSASDMLQARDECYKPKFIGDISQSSGAFAERPDGLMRVWSKPKAGKRYVLGADVAEGLAHGDYSSADVLEMPGGIQVSQWRGHIDPDQFGVVLARIGNWYNGALIGVERNNHGLTTVTKLRDMKYRNLYAQEDLEHRADGKETKKLGWLTTGKSKLKIIDQLAAELRDADHGICCVETIDEMGTYVIDEQGRYGAKPGCFDDRVMSRAIAGEMARSVPASSGAAASPAKTFVPVDNVAGY